MKVTDSTSQILVSVVIPVYNSGTTLMETLESIINQTLNKDLYEIIIVDDCSIDRFTIELIDRFSKSPEIEGVALKIIRHEKNMWSAAARNTGVLHASGKYICCLDSDDYVDRDYLKKSVLILESHPRAGWVYPNINNFGKIIRFIPAVNFRPYKFFLTNHVPISSVVRKDAWLKIGGQRTKYVTKNMKFFEDWDMWIRLMAKGWYGIPCKDIVLFYRQSINSNISRSFVEHLLSRYLVYRANLWRFFLVYRAGRSAKKDIKEGREKKRLPFSPLRLLERGTGFLATLMSGGRVRTFPFKLLIYGLFAPRYFIKRVLNGKDMPTLAEMSVKFWDKPKLSFRANNVQKNIKQKNTIFFAHHWWHFGGAENVLLDWIQSAKAIPNVKIIDIVEDGAIQNSHLENKFKQFVDEQYSLSRMATNPLSTLKLCWQLIEQERPSVIYIMSNAAFYILVPHIKRAFPEITIIDLLHNEDPRGIGWFEISSEYQSYIDQRVVISDYWKKVLMGKYGQSPEKVSVVMNAIDTSRFDPSLYSQVSLKGELNIEASKCVIGSIGRLDYEKNPMVFVELAEIMKNDPRFYFVIVGNGKYEKKIRERVATLPNIKYYEYTTTPERFYALFDVLVFPSLFEGYPLVGMEAAAMNTPIIATDIVGFHEQIEMGNFGILYEPKLPGGDAQIIRGIIYENLDKWSEIGGRGRNFVTQYHSWDVQKEKYKNFLLRFLK